MSFILHRARVSSSVAASSGAAHVQALAHHWRVRWRDYSETLAKSARARVQSSSEALGLWILNNVAQVQANVVRDPAKDAPALEEPMATSTLENSEILGDYLGSFGPKHLYSATIKELMDLEVWENQRTFCGERAENLARSK